MSLPPPPVQRPLFDVESLLGREFDPADRFRLFREKVYPLLPAARKELEACCCRDNGRRAEEPVVLLGATVMQFMERSPDRQAAECVSYHPGWKLALGLELAVGAFHPTTLCTFRERLLRHDKAKVAFDAVLSGLVEAGLVPRRSRQRLDSTHVLGLVAKMSGPECVREALRLALQEVAKAPAGMKEAGRPALPAWWPQVWERYVESGVDYRAGEAALADKTRQAGEDALRLLEWVGSPGAAAGAAPGLAAGGKVSLLRRVFAEQFEAPAGPGEAVRPRPAPPAGAVKNPHDPEAQWSTKSNRRAGTGDAGEARDGPGTGGGATVPAQAAPVEAAAGPSGEGGERGGAGRPPDGGKGGRSRAEAGRVGYKVQVSETVQDGPREEGEPTASFLTAVETQPATHSDYAGMEQVMAAQAASGLLPPSELYVDTAFVSAAGLKRAEQEGRELVGPAQPARDRGRGFKSDEFDVDVGGRKATCPAGHASTNCSRLEEKATGKVSFRFEWGGGSGPCAACPLRGRCLSPGVGHRTLVVGPDHSHLQKRRREMETGQFRERMKRRNAIEGTISELARGHGVRRARSRGLKKVTLRNHLIGAACNARRRVRRAAWETRRAAQGAARALTGTPGAAAGA